MTASATSVPVKNSTIGRAKKIPVSLRAVRSGMQMLSRIAPEGAAAVAERMFLTPRRYARPAAETAFLASARRFVLATEHGDLAAWEWGSEGPRVLLVHGWEGRGAQLGAFAAPLVGLGFRVVTFDAPGHGDSAGNQSSFFHFSGSIARAAHALGPLHAIVAHSMGAATTLWASREGLLAERLVMVAPPVDLRHFTAMFAKAMGLTDAVRTRLHRRLTARFGIPLADVRAEAVAPAMRGPLLVVHDEEDHEVPIACGELVARVWPGAELLRTRGLGHRRVLRDPNTVGTIVRFVGQSTPKRLDHDPAGAGRAGLL